MLLPLQRERIDRIARDAELALLHWTYPLTKKKIAEIEEALHRIRSEANSILGEQ